MKHTSGSPASWKARRVEYQKRSGPVSNPGQPSLTNRHWRRQSKRLAYQNRSESDES